MNSTTLPFTRMRRQAAAVVVTAVVAVAGVACGTETVDDGEPAAPAQVKVPAQQPQSLRSAERDAEKQHQQDALEQYYDALKRHYTPAPDAGERDGAKLRKERSPRQMGRPGPGL